MLDFQAKAIPGAHLAPNPLDFLPLGSRRFCSPPFSTFDKEYMTFKPKKPWAGGRSKKQYENVWEKHWGK
jgi:hypothetical protein